MYMSGHAVCDVCVSVSVLVRAYGNCTQMSSWWWLNLEIDLNNLTFWQVPSTTCCWYHQNFQVSLGTTPTPSNSHNQGLVPFLAGNPELNLHLWLESWCFCYLVSSARRCCAQSFHWHESSSWTLGWRNFRSCIAKRVVEQHIFTRFYSFVHETVDETFSFLISKRISGGAHLPLTPRLLQKTWQGNLFLSLTHWHTIFFWSIFGWTTDQLQHRKITKVVEWMASFLECPLVFVVWLTGCATEMAWTWHAWHNWHTFVHVHLGLPSLPW